MTGGVSVGTRTNGFTRKTLSLSPEAVADGWTCKKRDGATVPFDVKKIRKALFRCFHAVSQAGSAVSQEELNGAVEVIVEEITKSVVNTIEAKHIETPEVEQVQQFIIQQLWAKGLFNHAEHYQNYREAHRKSRLVKPVAADVQVRFDEMKAHFPTDLQIYQLMSKFAKWDEAKGRRETWKELVFDRVCPWLFRRKEVTLDSLPPREREELAMAMYNLEVSPAMRVVQMAGPALDRCNVGAYNCAYAPSDDIFSFPEMLYILMQGTGQGFSAEAEYVSELPRVKKQKGKAPVTLKVEDSTEGWCNTYFDALKLLWDGYDFVPDVSGVRKKGSRLKTKGGRASGPEPFVELLDFSRNLIKSIQGRYMEPHHAHRLNCFTGRIVQVGGVRRAAEIGLSDLGDRTLRDIKSGAWWAAGDGLWVDGKYLSMSNNSAVYEETPPMEVFMEEWLALVKSKSGERGIFNREAALKHSPKRRKWGKYKPGCNPCVTADTWVLTNKGPYQVKHLLKSPFEAIVDGKVYGSDGFFQTGVKPVKKVRLHGGVEFRATENHKVLVVAHQTQKTQRTEWKEVKDLTTSDRVVLHDHRGAWWQGAGSLEEGWLLGNLLGDGNIQADGQANLDFWGPDCTAMQEIAVTRIHQTVGGRSDLVGSQVSELKVRVQSANLGRLARSYGLTNGGKTVTPLIEGSSAAFHVGFLRGYFDADGSVQGSTAKGVSVRLTSVAMDDLKAVQRMLARLGVISVIYPERHPAGPQLMPDGKGGLAAYECQARHELVIANDNIGVFAERIGFDDPTKRTQLATVLASYTRSPNRERFCQEVVAVEDDGVEPVYDCTVPGPAAFDANGAYVHNCAEILLRPRQFCNLSIVVARPDDTVESLRRKVRLAAIFGKIQSLATEFNYIRPEWKKNCEEERLLGVDITAHADCPLLRFDNADRKALLRELTKIVEEVDVEYSRRFGVNRSAANTTVKPGGDSAVFFNCASGVSPWFAPYTCRWVRESQGSPVSKFLIDSGVQHAPAPEAPNELFVFAFPRKAPAGATTRGDMTAVQQFYNWLEWKQNWAEHSVSATIYADDHEWMELGAEVYKHFDHITGLSFLPRDNGTYKYAPNEELTPAQYDKMVAEFPDLNWAKLTEYESEDQTESSMTMACVGDKC